MRFWRSFMTCCLWLCGFMAVCLASEFDGTWHGTYNGQSTTLLPDNTFPETVSDFELRLIDRNGKITGEFRDGGEHGAWVRIRNGKRFGERACFDVVRGRDDMRWCVQAASEKLAGAWSSGPQGGPLLRGAGVGARLFKIDGFKTSGSKRE